MAELMYLEHLNLISGQVMPSNVIEYCTPEIDISVSKLLGFETFANFFRVSVSVSENLVSEKKSRYWFRKIWYRKKVLVSVLVTILVSSFSAPRERGWTDNDQIRHSSFLLVWAKIASSDYQTVHIVYKN